MPEKHFPEDAAGIFLVDRYSGYKVMGQVKLGELPVRAPAPADGLREGLPTNSRNICSSNRLRMGKSPDFRGQAPGFPRTGHGIPRPADPERRGQSILGVAAK